MFSIYILSKCLGAKLHSRGHVTHPAPCGDIRGGLSRVPRHPGQHSAAGIQSSLTHPGYPPQRRQSAKLFLHSLELGLSHPLTRRRMCSPILWFGGRWVYTLAGGKGGGGFPIPTRGHTWYFRYVGMYFVFPLLDLHSSVLDAPGFLFR